MWVPLLMALALRAALAACPRLCECKWRSGKESVVCARAGLTDLPAPLDPGTQLLDLTGNRISTLLDNTFANAGLVNLQRVYLTECGLRGLRRNAFRALVNLVELNLAGNRIEVVPSHAFPAIPELRDLHLDHNPISRLKDESFASLPHLVRLHLSACKIMEIEHRAFAGVEGSLEFLKIDGNRLHTLHAAALAPLRALQGLELAGNPWECTCELRPLRDWMLRRNLPATVVPECSTPSRLIGRSWDRLDLEEFACPPEVSAAAPHTSGLEGSEVTLACRVRGVPAPRVRWMRGGRPLGNSTSPTGAAGRTLLLRGEGQLSNLTIRSTEVLDAGAYTCAAENRAGRAEASVTLAVERRPPGLALSGRTLLVGVSLAALLALGLCVLVLLVYETRKKRQVNRWNEQIVMQNRNDDSYVKIELKGTSGDGGQEASVGVEARTRGDYRNVPSQDTEDEAEAYNEEQETPTPPAPSHWRPGLPRVPSSQHAGISVASAPPQATSRWPSDEPDLHIPRMDDYSHHNIRNITSRPTSSLSGPRRGNLANKLSAADENQLNNNLARSAMRDRLDNDLSGSDSEKNYPDLIEMSAPSGYVSYSRARRETVPGSSAGASYYCTLPRRQSRSPLLDSRRSSSGGDSAASCGAGAVEWRARRAAESRRSNSFLDLSGERRSRRNPSLPTSPTCVQHQPSATPLLDLAGLRDYSRLTDTRRMGGEDYDLNAIQLERFLDEYRTLHEQLTRMKETRESLQRARLVEDGGVGSDTGVAVTAASLPDAASPLALSTPLPPVYSPAGPPRSNWLATTLYRA